MPESSRPLFQHRLSLKVAHQYLTQRDEPTANTVFGNVGSTVTFQVGNDDARRPAEQLGKHRFRHRRKASGFLDARDIHR